MASPLDSPSPPDPPPPSRRRRKTALRWLTVLAAAILLLVVADWWHRRPLARIPLPDGRELLLVEAYYAPAYSERVGLVERLRSILPGQKGSRRREPVLYGTPAGELPALWLVFEAAPPQQKVWGEHGCVRGITTMDARMRLEGAGASTTHEETKILRNAVGLSNYPRRGRELHVGIGIANNRHIEVTIPNPFPITAAPSWTPEPIPQVRKLKNRAVVLRSLVRHSEEKVQEGLPLTVSSVQPEFEIREPGIPADAFKITHALYDPTGNRSTEVLPTSEPVWKIQTTVRRNGKYPFQKSEMQTFGPTYMPSPGEFHILALPPHPVTGTVHHAILVGQGEYRLGIKDDLTIELTPEAESTLVKCDAPGLLVLDDEPIVDHSFRVDADWIFRVMHNNRTADFATPTVLPRGSQTRCLFFMFVYNNLVGVESPPEEAILEFQSIVVEDEIVDFYVQPPP